MLARRGTPAAAAVERPRRLLAGLFAVAQSNGEGATAVVAGVGGTRPEEFVGSWLDGDGSHTLEQIVAGLRTKESWAEWMDASHVLTMQDVRDDIDLTEFERGLDRDLGSLASVCRTPRTLLRPEEERNPVSRVRRVASRTVVDLLSHPRDWERRTLHGIQPARVLSVVAEDDWDLYENRVAARLVERLLRVLGRRVERLEKIQHLLGQGSDFADVRLQSHWRRDRINHTWMRVACDDSIRGRLEVTLDVLRRMRDLVRGLLASPLYANVPRNAHVDDSLRPTNVLVNDRNYRKVAGIWRGVLDEDRRSVTDPEEQMRARLADVARFDDYANLLVLQALHGLGYEPVGVIRMPVQRVRLKGARGLVDVARQPDGTTAIKVEGASLAVVALPVHMSGGDLADVWASLREAKAPTLFLLHGELEPLLDGGSATTELRRAFSAWTWPRVLFVSPVTLDAVERVGRVVNQWDVSARLGEHPSHVSWRGDIPKELPAWVSGAKGTLAVARPLGRKELDTATTELDRRREFGGQDPNVPEKARRGIEPWSSRLLDALRELRVRAETLSWASSCPVCRRDRISFKNRWQSDLPIDQQTFWAECESCFATWGLARCGTCRRTYPALDPSLAVTCPSEVTQLDRTYGRDLWCELRLRSGAHRIEMCCPSCLPPV